MGMYTELIFKADVKKILPTDVEAVLQHLFNGDVLPSNLPEHPLFGLPRWTMIGRGCSYYHVPWVNSKYSEGYIFSRSDLKNYDGEIEAFIDWIRPYLDEHPEKCVGWMWYEELDAPVLIYAGGRP